jgi:hypothetical protein
MLYLFSYINDDKLSTKVVTVGGITHKCMGYIECDKYEFQSSLGAKNTSSIGKLAIHLKPILQVKYASTDL